MLLDDIFREITNAIYGVSGQVERFKAREPDAVILAAGATKGRRLADETAVRAEPGWVTARRATLILTDDRLVCGDWKIPLASVEQATLLRVRSLLAKAFVLQISTTSGDWYQFGLQYDPAWERQTALKLTIKDGKIKHSAFSMAVRAMFLVLLLLMCCFWGWLMFGQLAR